MVLGPVMPQTTDLAGIADTLTFLTSDYELEFKDPLCQMNHLSNEDYYQRWHSELEQLLENYDAFFGFSFGGVILQQCLSLFAEKNKPIVLFSTPSYKDLLLEKKLSQVIGLCQKRQMQAALRTLYQDVFYPNALLNEDFRLDDEENAASRLIFGLERVLMTDARPLLSQTTVFHLHLIGECSHLVNHDNVVAPHTGQLLTVPGAGMRVLQDNPVFCQNAILKRLEGA